MVPESPAIVITHSVLYFNLCTWDTADWSVPTVSYTGVEISCVKAFKISIQRDKTLQQKCVVIIHKDDHLDCISNFGVTEQSFQSVTIHWKAVEQYFTVVLFNFTQFVILENLSTLDLAMSVVKGLKGTLNSIISPLSLSCPKETTIFYSD